MKSIIHCDYETFSEADLEDVGTFHYANHPSTEILMLSLAEDDDEPVIWLPEEFVLFTDWYSQEEHDEACRIIKRMSKDDVLIYAHNAMFELAVSDALFKKTFGRRAPSHSKWRCTQAMARRAALPAALADIAKFLNLRHQKDKRGEGLIKLFTQVQPAPKVTKKNPNPVHIKRIKPLDRTDDFRAFTRYCKQDVRVEQEVHQKLDFFELDGFALDVFQADIKINTRGFPVNLDGLKKAQKLIEEVKEDVVAEFRRLTGLNPTQIKKLKEWFNTRGLDVPNLQAPTIEAIVTSEDFDETTLAGRAMKMFSRVNYAATAKIATMLRMAGPHDNRVRGGLLYHGAGPGRWSAKGVQAQNMKRPDPKLIKNMDWQAMGYKNEDEALDAFTQMAYRDICAGASRDYIEAVYGPCLEVLSSCIRHFMHDIDEDGTERPMISADYSAIEARLLAWVSGEEWRMEVFRTHGKIYEASAMQMFGLTMEEITKALRQKGKISELALGYQGSVGALLTMGALKMGLTEEELPGIVKRWRKANKNICSFWRDVEKAAKNAVRKHGKKFWVNNVAYFCKESNGVKYLFCQLPSKRLISYPMPRIEESLAYKYKGKWVRITTPTASDIRTAEQRVGDDYFVKDALTIYSLVSTTSNVWGRVPLHGGILTENICQGIAADIMSIGLLNLEAAGYPVVNIIHDEAVSLMNPDIRQTGKRMCRLMTDLPEEYADLPLPAEGGVIPFYKK